MKIDWKRKLSSRKFWCTLAALATSLLAAFGVAEHAAAQAGIIIAGIGALVAYIIAEACIDKDKLE